jgi:class 3 adenylate cyclase
MRFVILSVDIADSTKMSQELRSEEYSKIISLFSKEVALIISKFNGYVLKFQGDGIIAYFPEPNFIGMNDNAVDCAAGIRKLILEGINKILAEHKLPQINSRIGVDAGFAIVATIGIEKVKMHKDLIGETINLSCKIQSLAEKNQILVGETATKNVHTFWRQKLQEIDTPMNWEYKDKRTGEKYRVFALTSNI